MVQVEVQVDAWLIHGSDLLVQVYSGISHSDSVTVVPSVYFYFRVAGWGKDRWLYLENIGGCSLLLVVAIELGSWNFPQVVA
jgi:hypothetical protein